jgi:hypothetical protein
MSDEIIYILKKSTDNFKQILRNRIQIYLYGFLNYIYVTAVRKKVKDNKQEEKQKDVETVEEVKKLFLFLC